MPCRLKIVSGGQTGADRAALSWAIRHGFAHGGWVPKGRLAADGKVPSRYRMQETPTKVLTQRTDWNVRDSDATVLFTISGKLGRGSKRTLATARRLRKPCLVLSKVEVENSAPEILKVFLKKYGVRVVNIAGSRASQEPEVSTWVRKVLNETFRRAKGECFSTNDLQKLSVQKFKQR